MPLYVDDKQVNPKTFVLGLGIEEKKYERIIKRPTFKLDKGRVQKKKTINSPLAKKTTYGIITSFWFRDKDGMMKRLRYAESQQPKVEGGVMRYNYEPGRLNVEGGTVNFLGAPDKAIFMFLNPGNPTSPFADKTKKKFAYMDTIEQTKADADSMSNIQRALTHATTMEEEELVIVAKGLKLLKNDDYELEELRVRLQQFAINPATNKRYVQAMDDDMVRIEGRIRNLVDKGIFKLDKRGSTRQWIWAQGSREGEYIGESIMNGNEDAIQRLFNYIKANLGDYLYDLRNSTGILQADRKAREVLAAEKNKPAVVEVPAHLAAINNEPPAPPVAPPVDTETFTPVPTPPPVAGFPTLKDRVTTFAQARDFVGEKGYPKNSTLIKTLWDAIQEGVATDDNINSYMVKLFEKA